MKIVFLGTARIAVPSLEAILDSVHDVLFCITRPDKPAGRHRDLKASPLKDAAQRLGVELLQPAKAREVVPTIRERGADACCVVAYGGWLPPPVLEATPRGCVNVHPSLLPRWRGAAPVERAIMAGDSTAGVSTMLIDEGLDTGPLLLQREAEIRADETAGDLQARLALIGAELLVETLDALEAGAIEPRVQSEAGATYADKLEPEGCRIDWTAPASQIDGLVRGANPRPGAWTTLDGKRFKVWRTGARRARNDAIAPGAVLETDPFCVQAGDTGIELVEVQPEGKARMSAAAFVRGYDSAGAGFE